MPVMTEEEIAVLPTAERKKALEDNRKAEKAEREKAEQASETPKVDEKPKEPQATPTPKTERTPPEPQQTPQPEPEQPSDSETVAKKEYEQIKKELAALKKEVGSQPYKTLQGKYKNEVPRLHSELKEQKAKYEERLKGLEDKIAAIAREKQEPREPQVPAHLRHLTPEEREEYGSEESIVLKQARGLIEDNVQSASKTLAEKLSALEGMVKSIVTEKENQQKSAAESKIWAAVETLIPNAREINDDIQFQEWLLSPDPDSLTGANMLKKAEMAFELGDVKTVANVLKQGADALGFEIPEPADSQEPASQRTPAIKPNRQTAQSAPTSTQKGRNIPVSEIMAFYDAMNSAKGLRKKDGSTWTQQEIDAKEKEYERAMEEGRIVKDR